jgi:hypothetical protein
MILKIIKKIKTSIQDQIKKIHILYKAKKEIKKYKNMLNNHGDYNHYSNLTTT